MFNYRAKVRKLPYTVILCVLASIVVLVFNQSPHAKSPLLPEYVENSTRVPLPELVFKTESGKAVHLSDQKGKVIILHFWASWCPPCITELPALDAFAGKYKEKDISFVVVSLDNQANQAKAAAFYKEHHIRNLPLLFASQKEAMAAVKLKGLPTTLFAVENHEIARANADLAWRDDAIGDYIDGLLSGSQ